MKAFLAFLLAGFLTGVSLAEEVTVIDANDREALKAAANSTVTIEGVVTDIHPIKAERMVIVFGKESKESLVVTVFPDDLGSFPDGLDKYRGQKVRVTGTLKILQGASPRMRIKAPDQITIVSS